jgi:endogenous inhibitor of DNA gyrase (YacG/DUF329 family)
VAGLALIPLALAFGISGGLVGRRKGSSFWIWFLVSAIPPFFGLFAALAYRYESDELRRQCPTCGKVVRLTDAVCTRCGTDLEWPDVAIAPVTAPPAQR